MRLLPGGPVTAPYRSPLLALPGAVPADPPDEGVAAHYGDPYREQRQLEAGTGAVDLSHRGVLRVSGPDRLTWLHALTTQHLERLAPGEGTTALVLSPHGHVEHVLALVDDGASVWAHVERSTVEPLAAFLLAMRFWSKVEVEDVTDAWAVVWRPASAAATDSAEGAGAAGGVARRVPGGFGRELVVPRERLADVVGDQPAGVWAWEALRIASGRPRHLLETDHRTIPHELGWIGEAVHLDKGCYRGQETVARVHNLGRPPRRLVLLHLDGSVDTLPAHGDPVQLEGRTVGAVGSAQRHHELGPVALALVKRSVPDDAPLVAGGVAASQEPLVRA